MQHDPVSEVEQISPPVQFVAQLTVSPVQGSLNEAQDPEAHVFGLQHVFWSVAPEAPHCSPVVHVAEQVNVVPLQGSFQVPPQ